MMTIDADDVTYQVKASEAAGRRLMKDRNSGLVFWATPETVAAADLQGEEPTQVGREILPEFLRKEPKRRAPRKRPVDGA
jgi:hypothetical protein